MHFPAAISTLALLASAVTAAPAPEAAPVAQGDQDPNRVQVIIHLWIDTDFRGNEFTGSARMGECRDLDSPYDGAVSSGRADRNGMRCTVWADRRCMGPSVNFELPGDRNFRGNFGGRGGSSWRCDRA